MLVGATASVAYVTFGFFEPASSQAHQASDSSELFGRRSGRKYLGNFELHSEFSGAMPTPNQNPGASSIGSSSESWLSESSNAHAISDAISLAQGSLGLYAAVVLGPYLIGLAPSMAPAVGAFAFNSTFQVVSSSMNLISHAFLDPKQVAEIHLQMNWVDTWGLSAGLSVGLFDSESADLAAEIAANIHRVAVVPSTLLDGVYYINDAYNTGLAIYSAFPGLTNIWIGSQTNQFGLLNRDLTTEIGGFADHPLLTGNQTQSTPNGGGSFGGGGDPGGGGFGGGGSHGGGIYDGAAPSFYWSDNSSSGGGGGNCQRCMLA